MQLHLETDELNLLADLLMQKHGPQELLEMVLARDLRFDSDALEQLADLLAVEKQRLKDEISHQPNAFRKCKLQDTLAVLERVLEHVDEACVMI